MSCVYLDHHAAAPVEMRVRQAMQAAAADGWANPASVHSAGRAARRLLEDARRLIASAIGAEPAEIVLTSGGTEAIHLGILGLRGGIDRVISLGRVDHPAVVATLNALGVEQVALEGEAGALPPPERLDALERPLGPGCLVAVGWVNHETGAVLDVEAYGERCRRAGAHLFVDAVQALGKLPVDLSSGVIDVAAFAAHKMGGPPGSGALYVRRGIDIEPSLVGGKQERGRRAGSPDPVAHVGFAAACELLDRRLERMASVGARRDRLERELVALGGVVNGSEPRVATVVNASFATWRGAELVAALDVEGLCASSGPACSSGVGGPSSVIEALYPDEPWRAASSLRLSLGPTTTDDEIECALRVLREVIPRA